MKPILRAVAIIFFLSVVVGLALSIHYYLAGRLVLDAGLGGASPETVYLAVMGGGTALIILAMLSERLLPPPGGRLLTWPGYLWMGTLFLLLVTTGVSDLVLLVVGWPAPGSDGAIARAAAVLGLALLLAGVGAYSALRTPPYRRVELRLDRWPAALDGFRIAQISDLHIGPVLGRGWARRLVTRVNALEADLIVVTGDLIDGFVSRQAGETLPLRDLRAPQGVFVITGNHEMFNGVRSWTRHYEAALGMTLLANAHVTITPRPGAGFILAGTHDRSGFTVDHPEDLDAALGGRDPALPVILLAHDPTTFRKASKRPVDLQLSGHTHGGQIWPFHYPVRLAVPYLAGHYRVGDSQLYVSRGSGFWGPPVRLGAPPEITEVILRST